MNDYPHPIIAREGWPFIAIALVIALVLSFMGWWPLAVLAWLALIFIVQFLWSLGGAGFPAVQQARLISVAPALAAATIALNSSVTYLGGSAGATIGSTAWTVVAPRFLPWVGFLFIVAALLCSMRGEKASREVAAAT